MKKRQQGLTLVELMIATAIGLIFLPAVNQLLSIGVRSTRSAQLRTTAVWLANEGAEAMYIIRKNGTIVFTSGWTGLNTGSEYYQPTLSGGTWVLGSEMTLNPPYPLPSPYQDFTRTVKIAPVNRTPVPGCTGPVSDTGTCDDPNTRKVTVTVSWYEGGVQRIYKTVNLLTNI